jgi:diguanylate cyclase (GGDEF)-like protein/PAS domain S-box-containing protein
VPLPSLTADRRAVTDDIRRLHRHLLTLTAVVLVVAAVSLYFGWETVTRIRPAWPELSSYTIVGASALVLAMLLFWAGGRVGAWIARILAALTMLLGGGVDFAVGAGLLPSSDPTTSYDGTWVTALPSLAAVAASASVMMIGLGRPWVARVRFSLAAGAGIVSLLVLLSYVYGSVKLFHQLGTTGTSVAASIIGLLVVFASMSATPDQPPLASLDDRYDRVLLRRILPMLLVAPFLPATVEWLVNKGEPDRASAAAIAQVVTIVILIVVITVMGGSQSRARRELTAQRQRVWDAFEHAPAATAVVSVDGRIVTANEALARLARRSTDELAGTQVGDLIADPDHGKVAEALAEVGAGRSGFRRDIRFRGPGIQSVWVDLNVAPVSDSSGRVTYLILQCTDLTDRKHLERVLADQSVRDPLTGLLNREGLERQVERLTASLQPGQTVVIVHADVDGMRTLNDSAGDAAGDDLLREVARRLRAATRDEDLLARMGSDEFAVVTVVPANGPHPADHVVGRLRRELSGPIVVGHGLATLSVSIGAATLDPSRDAAAAFSEADRAMHSDKQEHRRASDR